MIAYRAFRNTDPPALAELWCNHPPQRALVQPMTVELLDQKVFSKPYFDRHGLIVAEEQGRVVGFAHAGFGCNDAESDVCTRRGATCLLMVAPHEQHDAIAEGLLNRCEAYLTENGAHEVFAGSVYPVNPFYLGLYGGSHSPGILESDQANLDLFRRAGYREQGGSLILQRTLSGFRPIVDRQQMLHRREYQVDPEVDPPTETWWQACTIAAKERVRHQLISRRDRSVCGEVTFWDMERISGSWGVHAMGLMDLQIRPELRQRGLATFLVGEALRHLGAMGVSLAEAQVEEGNQAALALFRKLGFQQVDRGVVLLKVP
jgi:ribosomal protein S18 acetylase RimI-like enzyme